MLRIGELMPSFKYLAIQLLISIHPIYSVLQSHHVKKAIVRLNTPIVYAHKREDCQEVSFTLFRFIRVQECAE